MKIRIHKILKNTKVEGPKTRYCIWFQGCSRHCNGCWAKATWDFNAGIEYDVNEILTDILNTKNIDGVTFLGGEPFEQPEALEFLCKNIKNAGLSVICFSGNTINNLSSRFMTSPPAAFTSRTSVSAPVPVPTARRSKSSARKLQC